MGFSVFTNFEFKCVQMDLSREDARTGATGAIAPVDFQNFH